MSFQSNQVSFIQVQFFAQSSTQYSDQSDYYSQNQKDTLIENQHFSNQEIFIQPDSITDSAQLSHNGSRTKSVLHNFQKHLFTFIQSLIPKDFDQKQINEDKEQKCVKKILRLVKGQKKKTREELVPIFGNFNTIRAKNKSFTYKGLTEQFSEGILNQSLNNVKSFLMQRMNIESIRDYVQRSKMGRKGEFIGYVQSFIREVQEGRFGCRLSKKSQTQMRQRISEQTKQKEWQSLIL